MTVKPGLTGAKAKLIDSETWSQMEASWVREFGPQEVATGSNEARMHYHVHEYASGGHPRRTVGIFNDRAEAVAYAQEYIADWEDIVIRGDAETGFSFTSEESNYQADLGTVRVESCERVGCKMDV